MRDSRQGFTLLEALVVLALLGLLAGVALGSLRPDQAAVRQAAQGLAASVGRARLEAIKANAYAGVRLDTAAQAYALWVDVNGDRVYTAGTDRVVQRVALGQGELKRVALGAGSSLTLVFDSRGIPLAGTGGSVVLANPQNTYSKTVVVNAQGRARVQ